MVNSLSCLLKSCSLMTVNGWLISIASATLIPAVTLFGGTAPGAGLGAERLLLAIRSSVGESLNWRAERGVRVHRGADILEMSIARIGWNRYQELARRPLRSQRCWASNRGSSTRLWKARSS